MAAPLSETSRAAQSLTAELRFWWPNRQTAILRAWLEEKGIPLAQASERADIYLPTDTGSLNLKRRDGGKIEIKSLVQQQSMAAPFAGEERCEIWVKHVLGRSSLDPGPQLTIAKTRWLAYLDKQGQILSDGETGSSGCQIELSEVQPERGQQIWTSFCLEAFGDPDGLPERLDAAVRKLGELPCPEQRPLVASYAEWLHEEDYFDVA
ncbi:hypothetical protein [Parasphingorhabdus sp.]|uniref:hypothetical protein n=1 Tax=Parasphingorhabdus sp. TaxID=2709688 RepID=UPI003002DBA0